MLLKKRRRRGTVVVMLAIFLIPIVAIMAIVLDGGILMGERRHAQAVADAAALAAANNIYQNYSTNGGLDPSYTARDASLAIASGNGYTNDGTTSTVTVNIPPQSGSFKATSGYAEINVTYNQPRYFSALWGSGTNAVRARSVARGMAKYGTGLLLLDPSMQGALNITSSADINVPNGTIIIDSSNVQAGYFSNTGNATASRINIYGNWANSNTGKFVGTVKTGVSPTADPLANLAIPDKTTMTIRSTSTYQIAAKGIYTLQPGVYKGGISISAPGPGLVTLQSGIYYMDAGGFAIAGSIDVTGAGVMIYNAPAQTSQKITLTGQGNLTLTAPTSGTYKGITIFQDRTSAAPIAVTGGGNLSITGTVYAAKAETDVTGNGGVATVGSEYICNNMKVTGAGSVNIAIDTAAQPPRDVRIVE